MKPGQRISEEDELAIFDRLQAGDSLSQIARDFNCSRWLVGYLRDLGSPRWRHKAHGELHPSPALIAWHCRGFQGGWSESEEIDRQVVEPTYYDFPVVSKADLDLPTSDSDVRSEEPSV